jgi:hypothetical protein
MPIDCNLVNAADDFLEAVAGATGEAGSFPDFTMMTCEACKELEQETYIPRVLASLHTQLYHVETGDKFLKNKRAG